jgi:hypothetical protein
MKAWLKKQRFVLCLAFFFLFEGPFHFPATAEASGVVTWLVLDFPPLFIVEGADAGRGIADRVQKMINKGLKGHSFKTRVANASRISKELKEESNVCFAGEFYGNPVLPYQYTHHGASSPSTGHPQREHPSFRGRRSGLPQGPSSQQGTGFWNRQESSVRAGAGRDPAAPYKGSKNIYERSGKDTLEGLLGMLAKKRVHYLVEYPVSIRYAANKAGIWDRLALIPIAENAEAPFVRGAVRCSDTPWGRRMIGEINEVLRVIRSTPEYRRIIEDWIITPGNEKAYWKIYERQVLNVEE